MPRYLSGIQPTSTPHIGNYFGAIEPHVRLASTCARLDGFFFVADLHALTTVWNQEVLQNNVYSVAATYLALGLDPQKCVFFRQSEIPEVTELTWLLMTCTGMGLLERAHSYKDKTAKGISPSVGLFTYPVLMAADILIYDSDVVPVGKDQIQHVEMTQDMAGHFNTRYSVDGLPLLRRPEWKLSAFPRVIGVDGEKMSSSYGNYISIFDDGKSLKKSVNRIVTDSRLPSEPKDPDSINAFLILEPFLDAAESSRLREQIRLGGDSAPGYGDLKKLLIEKMDIRFGAARDRFQFLTTEKGRKEIDEILDVGQKSARPIAQTVVERCYAAAGIAVQRRSRA